MFLCNLHVVSAPLFANAPNYCCALQLLIVVFCWLFILQQKVCDDTKDKSASNGGKRYFAKAKCKSANASDKDNRNGEEVVVDVWQIVMDEDAEIWDDRYPNIKFRYTAPADIFYPVSYFEYEDMKFSQGGIDYYLTRGEYGPYRSELVFEYDYEGTTLVGGEDNYLELEGKLQDNWLQLVDTMVLVVDGVEYPVNAEDKGYTYCDEKGEFGKKNHCNIRPYFPSIDLETAESIVIKAGDTSYILK